MRLLAAFERCAVKRPTDKTNQKGSLNGSISFNGLMDDDEADCAAAMLNSLRQVMRLLLLLLLLLL
jgi:hypothetical protein